MTCHGTMFASVHCAASTRDPSLSTLPHYLRSHYATLLPDCGRPASYWPAQISGFFPHIHAHQAQCRSRRLGAGDGAVLGRHAARRDTLRRVRRPKGGVTFPCVARLDRKASLGAYAAGGGASGAKPAGAALSGALGTATDLRCVLNTYCTILRRFWGLLYHCLSQSDVQD